MKNPPSSFEEMLDDLKLEFDQPASLAFRGPRSAKIQLRFPNLGTTTPPRGHSPHYIIRTFHVYGTSNFDYKRTTEAEWSEFMHFSNSSLISRHGKYKILATDEQPTVGINASPAKLTRWVRETLLQWAIAENDDPMFITGDPGTGKTTLFKYLLNKHRTDFLSNRIITSRFESSKFQKFYLKHKGDLDVTAALEQYLSKILLRDILFNLAYDRPAADRMTRKKSGVFARSGLSSDFFDTIFAQGGTDEATGQTDLNAFDSALGLTRLNQTDIDKISHKGRCAIISHFSQHWRYRVVFDGLDAISTTDIAFDEFNMKALELVLRSFAFQATSDMSPPQVRLADLPFDIKALFILRRFTFSKCFDDRSIWLRGAQPAQWEVDAVPGQVMLFNAIVRGIRKMVERKYIPKDANQASLADKLMQVCDFFVTFLASRFEVNSRAKYDILGVFQDNIREFFDFIGELLDWVFLEAHRMGHLSEADYSLEGGVDYLLSARARRLLLRRGYRLAEFFLIKSRSRFQNGLKPRLGSPVDGDGVKRLEINPGHSGVVDNLFNYHIDLHPAHSDHHCFLEKIRLLQCLPEFGTSNIRMTEEDMWSALEKKFGYISRGRGSRELMKSILIHGGFIVPDASEGEVHLWASKKARFVVGSLLKNQVYLEHVFHQTQFPEDLVAGINDTPRFADPDRWTISSIRNCYIVLAYIRHIEDNSPDNIQVPSNTRLWLSIKDNVWRSIEKSVRTDYAIKGSQALGGLVGMRALMEIRSAKDGWASAGVTLEN